MKTITKLAMLAMVSLLTASTNSALAASKYRGCETIHSIGKGTAYSDDPLVQSLEALGVGDALQLVAEMRATNSAEDNLADRCDTIKEEDGSCDDACGSGSYSDYTAVLLESYSVVRTSEGISGSTSGTSRSFVTVTVEGTGKCCCHCVTTS